MMKATAAAILVLLLAAYSEPAFAQGQVTNPKQPLPTPITQSSLPNSDKYKVEQKKRSTENAMRSFQAGNGTARGRQ